MPRQSATKSAPAEPALAAASDSAEALAVNANLKIPEFPAARGLIEAAERRTANRPLARLGRLVGLPPMRDPLAAVIALVIDEVDELQRVNAAMADRIVRLQRRMDLPASTRVDRPTSTRVDRPAPVTDRATPAVACGYLHRLQAMAAVIRDGLSAAGAVTVADLAAAGFTAAEIAEMANEAAALVGAWPNDARAA